MRSKILAGLLLAAVSLPAYTATVRMMGAGNVTCKEWTQLRVSTEYFSAGNWVLGFLSSTAWNTGKDILSGKKAETLFKAVDQYCSKEPDQSIADAAVELADHMLDKASPQ
ncbi:MAG: HdeA/HdeB family chaperone [Pseudomonadota bacterium]|nr:HdeA/HdeB family chaperone [Pseudomonadota bacterium]